MNKFVLAFAISSILVAGMAEATNKPPTTPTATSSSESTANAVGVGVGVGVGIADVDVKNSVNNHNNNTVKNTNQNVNHNSNVVKNTNESVNVNHNTQSQRQNQNQNQLAVATGGDSTAVAVGGNATGGNATVGDVTASVGDVTAQGGEGGAGGAGGDAVAAAVVETGAVQNTYAYNEVRQAPAIGQGSFAIQGCAVAGNAGGSWTGGAAFLGFGWTTEQCYDFMLAQAYQSLGEKKAACDILRNTKAGKRQEKRGVKLPGCEPEVVVIPAPIPVDLSGLATKEEVEAVNERLNRMHRAWAEK